MANGQTKRFSIRNDDYNAIFYGGNRWDEVGRAIACGDVNNDGIKDLILGIAKADGLNNSRRGSGEIHIFFGGSNLSGSFDLDFWASQIPSQGISQNFTDRAITAEIQKLQGFPKGFFSAPIQFAGSLQDSQADADIVIFGGQFQGKVGQSVASGDINGDGIDDIIFGAPSAGGPNGANLGAGRTYVIYGDAQLPSRVDLEGLVDVIVFGAAAGDASGYAVHTADLNGDGNDDLIIGSEFADGPDKGEQNIGAVYIIFGRDGLQTSLNLPNDADVVIFGAATGDFNSLNFASGRINDDDIDDLIIGAPLADDKANGRRDQGKVYVIFGDTNLPSVIELSPQVSGGAEVQGSRGAEERGSVGVKEQGSRGVEEQRSEVSLAPLPLRTPLLISPAGGGTQGGYSSLQQNTPSGITVIGANTGDHLGSSIAAADFDGDGKDDLVLGAANADAIAAGGKPDAGEVYVIYNDNPLLTQNIVDLLGNEANLDVTFLGSDIGGQLGVSVSTGDLNSDNISDIVIGANNAGDPFNPKSRVGEVIVIFGTSDPRLSGRFDLANGLSSLPTPTSLIIGDEAGDRLGAFVFAGDVSGDGVDDLIASAPLADPPFIDFSTRKPRSKRDAAGEAYIFFNVTNHDVITSVPDATLSAGTVATLPIRISSYGSEKKQGRRGAQEHRSEVSLAPMLPLSSAQIQQSGIVSGSITLRFDEDFLTPAGIVVGVPIPSSVEFLDGIDDEFIIDIGTDTGEISVDLATNGDAIFESLTELRDHLNAAVDDALTGANEDPDSVLVTIDDGNLAFVRKANLEDNTLTLREGNGALSKLGFASETTSTLFSVTPITQGAEVVIDTRTPGEVSVLFATDTPLFLSRGAEGQKGGRVEEKVSSSQVAGSDELIRINLLVNESPPSMPARTRLELAEVEYNEGAVTSIKNSADLLITDPSLGDANGDEVIDAADAADILMFLATGSPQINQDACDVSGDGRCTPYDAALILQFIIGKITSFPAQRMSGVEEAEERGSVGAEEQKKRRSEISPAPLPLRTPAQGAPLPSCSLAVPSIEGEPGSTVTLPIEITAARDLSSGRVVLRYDPRVLRARKITAGDLTAGFLVVSNVRLGTATFAFASDTPVSGDGVLANVTFEVNARAQIGDSSPLSLSDVSLNGGEIEATTTDGSFTVVDLPILVSAAQPSQIARGFRGELVIVGDADSGAFRPKARVKIKGIKVRAVRLVDSNHLAVTLQVSKRASLGNREIVVTNPDGEVGVGSNLLEVIGEDGQRAPRIDAITPDKVARGNSDQAISITGSGFTDHTHVSFRGGGIKVKSVTLHSQTELEVNVKVSNKAKLGTRDVKVSNPKKGGRYILRNALEVTSS